MNAARSTPIPDLGGSTPAGDPVYRPKLGSHIPALDGLRGLAVLLVLIFHFGWGDPDGEQTLVGQIWARAPLTFWVGVELFFVLSGFLITGILFDAKGSPQYLRNFYARRALRIFPLYYAALFLIFVIAPLYKPLVSPGYDGEVDGPWWLILYGQNLVLSVKYREMMVSDWVGTQHFWTLAVEEQFYLVWPLVVLLFRRKTLMVVCGVFMAGALALRVGLLALDPYSGGHWVLTPCKMDALGLGAFLALAARGPRGLAAYLPAARWVALGCGLTLFAIVEGIVLGNLELKDDWFMCTYGKSIIALFFGAVLVLAVMAPPATLEGRLWANPVLRFFGKYSYGIYVYHFLLIFIFSAVFTRERLLALCFDCWPAASLLYFAIATSISVAIAFVSWHLFEKQVLKLKVFFEYRAEPPREPARTAAVLPPAPALEPLKSAAL